ncbi:uncharacterized protein LOC128195960 [Vigna angularis]|uniref:uncharacterized protein LOC128195960 n=1 Tax=Phaseolus angularis TaxID=3914 RepID=UPI0022B48F5F|nr:uncharacterized protein LOC128195960 [Vigna angularis]
MGLPQGLYFLVMNKNHFDELKKAMLPDFLWTKPEGFPMSFHCMNCSNLIVGSLRSNFRATRTLQVMVASALVCWPVWNLLCVKRMSRCIHDYFGKLDSLDRCCTLKHMLLESQQPELVASLMTLK